MESKSAPALCPLPGPVRALSPLWLGVAALGLALLGILTRPSGLLAAFWPANAVLLGLFVRWPRLADRWGWGAAALGLLAADLLTGNHWHKALLLTLSNLIGVAVGFQLYMRLPLAQRLLKQPLAVGSLIAVTAMAALGGALPGMLFGHLYQQTPLLQGLLGWFMGELVNYLSLLPVLLTLPRGPVRPWRQLLPWRTHPLARLAPALALGGGLALGLVLPGPGAIVFGIPGLLWCALSYSLFATACLTLLTNLWTLLAVSTGHMVLGGGVNNPQMLHSLHMGITLVSLAPLTVASITAARNQLLRRLEHSANHDALTGALNRMGFAQQAERLLALLAPAQRPMAALMMDIDHFKRINDSHGHLAGDQVLAGFARVCAGCLRESDVFGRLGGEEFAVLLPDSSAPHAQAVAQRICDAFASQPFALNGPGTLQATVSVGVAWLAHAPATPEGLLHLADTALYQAKQTGRNRVVLADSHEDAPTLPPAP